jgi:AcrR family transcriptional regulator
MGPPASRVRVVTGHPGTGRSGTARGRERRERLLNATARLVAERGFHSVGIADIGAAAGVSGAAIYRHFENKDELLVALVDRVVDQLLVGARAVIRDAPSPEDALDELIRAHVTFALRDRAIIAVYGQEVNNLPAQDRRRLRRNQRLYAQLWEDVVAELRPELTDHARRATVHAAFGALNSVADFDARLADDELGELLARFARAGILPVSRPAGRA